MDLDPDSAAAFQCYDCPDGVQIFTTEEELLTHKWDKIRLERSEAHMNCHKCGLNHRTFEGLVRHYQLSHPADQNLSCPGCGAKYKRMHMLMTHLETDQCPRLTSQQVQELRRQKALAGAAAAAKSISGQNPAELGMFMVGESIPSAETNMADHLDRMTRMASMAGMTGMAGIVSMTGAASMTGSASMTENSNGGYGQYMGIDVPFPKGVMRNEGRSGALPPAGQRAQLGQGDTGGQTGRAAAGKNNSFSSTRNMFSRGDSKVPDLLTGSGSSNSLMDIGSMEAAKSMDVWSGQDMLVEDEDDHGHDSHGGYGGYGGPPSRQGRPGESEAARQTVSYSTSALKNTSRAFHQQYQQRQRRHMQADAAENFHLDPDHPSHPQFDVYKYRNPFTGRFNCPNIVCRRAGKTFKSAGAMRTHLQSETAHTSLRVQCPSCSRYFTSIQGLIQHCESSSIRCNLRETEEYDQFLDTLTGGVVGVEGLNVDLTVAYGVQKKATLQLEAAGQEEKEKEQK